jgi:hypothetical protein
MNFTIEIGHLPLMSSDRDAKDVHIVEVDALNRARLAVGHDDGLIDQLFLGSMQFPEDVEGSLFASHAYENSGGCFDVHVFLRHSNASEKGCFRRTTHSPAAGFQIPPTAGLVKEGPAPLEGAMPGHLRMRTRRSFDGLQRRFAPCGTVADQPGSYEIDGCG